MSFRRPSSLLVFDIETVVDVNVCSAVFNCSCRDVELCDANLRHYHSSANGNPFPKQFFHQVLVIGCAQFGVTYDSSGSEGYSLIKVGCITGSCESEIIQSFARFIDKTRPRLISFNGKGFDLPVLKYKAMRHNICMPIMEGSRYDNTWHCDLFDTLSDFGASSKNIKLHEICSLLRIPGKFDACGGDVLEMYLSNNIEQICDYCETDVISTYLVYLKYALRIGKMNGDDYANAIDDINVFLKNSTKPRLQKYYSLLQSSS